MSNPRIPVIAVPKGRTHTDRVAKVMRDYEASPGFTNNFTCGKRRGHIKRFTWHRDRYGAIVRFPLGAGQHAHRFYTIADNLMVDMGDAPPPPNGGRC